MYNDELYHYGVKGMKWGHRRARYTDTGSRRTNRKLNKLMKADNRYGQNRTARQNAKINKLYNKYDKSVAKDIKKASKAGDFGSANKMSASRTYLKFLTDSNYLNRAISDTAVNSKVKKGSDFTYKLEKDNSIGGVKITVNGHSERYVYNPNRKK